jgi:hypothetical protein
MNRGGGGERRHLLDFRCVSDAGAGVAIVCVAHMQQLAGLLPSACPGFLPTAAQPCNDFIFFEI